MPTPNVPDDKLNLMRGSTLKEIYARIETLEANSGGVGRGRLGITGIEPDIGLVENKTEDLLPRGGIVGVNALSIDPATNLQSFRNKDAFQGVVPDCAQHAGRFAVTLEPIKNNEFGHAIYSGIATADVDIKHALHRYCDVSDGNVGRLESCLWGSAMLLGQEVGLGVKRCKVLLSGQIRQGAWPITTNAAIAAAATGAVTVDESGEVLTAKNCTLAEIDGPAFMFWDLTECEFCIYSLSPSLCDQAKALPVQAAADDGDFVIYVKADLSSCFKVAAADCPDP